MLLHACIPGLSLRCYVNVKRQFAIAERVFLCVALSTSSSFWSEVQREVASCVARSVI